VSYVIAAGCCNDAACVDVCPVDAIRPHPGDPHFRTAEQLYIDPDTCIDCSACMFACPVSAIHDGFELPHHLSDFAAINAEYFEEAPLDRRIVGGTPASTPIPIGARIAVIGAGPAACYAVAELCRIPGITLTVLERLPTPFGLVRSGVAPDHAGTKQISTVFQSALQHPSVTCYFNVEVGKDVRLEELRRSHHAVIYAAGATGDRMLGIKGESLPGSHSARELVSWYNGHPDSVDNQFDFNRECAVVIGNGNVAMDVARILVSRVEMLETTDMADQAITALRDSAIQTVVIAARRGPADAACTTSELLALCQIPGVEVAAIPDEVADPIWESRSATNTQLRKREVFTHLADARLPAEPGVKRIVFRFGVQPYEIHGDREVGAITFRRLESRPSETETIECGLTIRAVGYSISRFPDIPFDESARTVANRGGRVIAENSEAIQPGLYCVGWAKRGPSGVIGTNKECSGETVAALLEDLAFERLPEPDLDMVDLDQLIRSQTSSIVNIDGWNRIDAEEQRRGRTGHPPKTRRKLLKVQEMLRHAGRPDSEQISSAPSGAELSVTESNR
jgi:ferredoxin--NADP+ reductase